MGKRVVVIDDADLVRLMLSDALGELGCNVVGEAADGAVGLCMAIELTPDLVFLDIEMPGMSGIRTLQEIKKAAPWVKVIMVTSVENTGVIDDCLLAGAEDYLRKDRLDELGDRIAPYLE
jgi:two-component system, chemotaxis family, chemotaxis protein CheY